ncbi:MAG: helix-turn-helix transcriptional regulator [Gemmatimonadota bacterium]
MPLDPQELLPLHPLSFEILLLLLDGPAHAYLIVKQLAEQSPTGQLVMPANLYRRIRDMLEQELIAERPVHDDPRRRREFRITPLGKRVAQAEARRLQGALALARSKGLLRNA